MGGTSMVRGGETRFLPVFRRNNFTSYVEQIGDVEFEFLGDGDQKSLVKSESSDEFHESNEMDLDENGDGDGDGEGERVDGDSFEENESFWDNQHQLLQTNLYRTSSVETRIRNATKEAVQDIQNTETVCSCSRQIIARSCRNCLMIEVSRRLQNVGFNSAVCKTKWKTLPTIPSGEHSFVDVIDRSGKKQEVIRVIIELNFRAEFEMAKASEKYQGLVRKLPEVYVGKKERLSNIIKVLCMAAKRCMKENKMHMGPWRKHKYMQAKWLGPCKRNTSTTSLISMGYSEVMPKPKPRASLLTVDLLETNFKTEMLKLPNLNCTVVEVL